MMLETELGVTHFQQFHRVCNEFTHPKMYHLQGSGKYDDHVSQKLTETGIHVSVHTHHMFKDVCVFPSTLCSIRVCFQMSGNLLLKLL